MLLSSGVDAAASEGQGPVACASGTANALHPGLGHLDCGTRASDDEMAAIAGISRALPADHGAVSGGRPRAAIDAVRGLLREQEERSDRIRRHLEALERAMPPVVSWRAPTGLSGFGATGHNLHSSRADAQGGRAAGRRDSP